MSKHNINSLFTRLEELTIKQQSYVEDTNEWI